MMTIRACRIAAVLGLVYANADAAVVTAVSCSSTHVQSAINAAVTGDTVVLPVPCSATWDTTVSIPGMKGITLDGTGATIERGSLANGSPALSISVDATTSTRVTGFTFTEGQRVALGLFVKVVGNGSFANYRLDHLTMQGSIGVAIWVQGPGLIDHCTITWTATDGGEMIHNMGYGFGNPTGWTSIDISPGGPDAVYIEDNTFNNQTSGNRAYFWGGSAVQSYYGARTVFRYNTCNNCQVDQHGTAGAVGARWWEIYENTFNVTDVNGDQSDYIVLRGGSGVVFNNHKGGFPNNGGGSIHLYEEDPGYPALYQVGRGRNQVLDPAYIWANDANDSTMQISVTSPSQIAINRDYYTSPKPGYVPYLYPHPLTLVTKKPAAPTNLRVIP